MKRMKRRLDLLLKYVFNVEDFYTVSVSEYTINMQGYASVKLINKCESFNLIRDKRSQTDTAIVYENKIIRICLTEKP